MNRSDPEPVAPAIKQQALPFGIRLSTSAILLLIGCLAIALPTLYDVARITWPTEQGSHGLIVLVTGLWLIQHKAKEFGNLSSPGNIVGVIALLLLVVPAFWITRISGIIELEGFAAYALILIAVYAVRGEAFMIAMAFPLVYLAFAFPPPDTVVYAITLPLKIWISEWSIDLLSAFGYPVGGRGVMIQIGPYELLVAAACAGLNSIISLSALTVFYLYLRHQSRPKRLIAMSVLIVPIAVFANFVRVIILMLITYHLGESAAQSYLHNAAGILMFVVALATIVLIDAFVSKLLGDEPVSSTREADNA